ncbi:hypothetical protein [Sorangium sp. So ce1000]|uniref:hypothetical protein n=1 Tax=Sorangium sp. So ce1000 TaxID=3133325 RepID=UPI003F5F49BA
MSITRQQGNFVRMRSRLYLVDDVARGAPDDEVVARRIELNRVRAEDERGRGWRWRATRANWTTRRTTMATTEAGALRARGSSHPLLTREHDA